MNLLLLDDEDLAPAASAKRDAGSIVARLACERGEEFVVELAGRRRDHVALVLRASVGRELVVGKLGGRIGRGVIEALDETRVRLRARLDAEPPCKLPLALLLALPRPKTLRRVLQCATTMGVARLVLMNSWRVEKSFWKSPLLEPAALLECVKLGLEQGRDTIPPLVETKRLLVPFAERELDALAAGTRRLLAHAAATTPCPRAPDEPVTLALGPEGGFIEDELALFARHGFEPVSLGPRPLRVEQALPALIGRLF
jgi:RsmE family RNA methyltransferase